MPLFDSGTPIAHVALSDTFNTWRIKTNQISTQAAGLASNNVFTGAENTFNNAVVMNSTLNAAAITANSFSGDGSGLTGLSAGLDWTSTTTNDEYYLFLTSNTTGSGIDQFEVSTGITFNPSSNTLTLGGNFVPAANVSYDLGTSEKRWKDLYLSGSTAVIGNAEITVTQSAVKIGLAGGNKLEIASDGSISGAVSSYANTSSNTAQSNTNTLVTRGGLLNFAQDSATITSSVPTNTGTTSNGHVWYIY